MASPRTLHVAVAGLHFGSAFVPCYRNHPGVGAVSLIDPDEAVLHEVGDRHGIDRRFTSLDEALARDDLDAVHLVTPIPLHAAQTLHVLEAGKHCACAVPMATTLDDLRAIVAAVRRTGLRYMMMETAVYSHEFFHVRDLLEAGELGRIQFLRGAHYQDMENWPAYWMGLPPTHYATHAVAPLLALAGCRATQVSCYGSGVMRAELHAPYGNPWPAQTALFRLEKPEIAAEVTRCLFQFARNYTESFSVYGDRASFEWQQIDPGRPVLFRYADDPSPRGRIVRQETIEIPRTVPRLREAIARFAGIGDLDDPRITAFGDTGHGGSHAWLAHEFVAAILEDRAPWIDEVTSANWTAPGICAHDSAMNDGAAVAIPCFD